MTDVQFGARADAAATDAIARLGDATARVAARRWLVGVGPNAVPALLRALAGGATERNAVAVIETLGEIGDLRAVAPLRRILRRGAPTQARAAAEALGRVEHGAAVWALRAGLVSSQRPVRIESALGLARLAASPQVALATEAGAALEAMDPADVVPLVDALLWRLPSGVREEAFAHVARVDPHAAASAALPHLHRQHTAASARGVLRCPEVVTPLVFRLNGENALEVLPLLAEIARSLRATPGDRDADATVGDIVGVLADWYDPAESALAAIVVEGLRAVRDDATTVLSARLAGADADELPYLIALLRNLAWEPTSDEAGVAFWLAAGEWERAAALGDIAREPLVAMWRCEDLERRDGIARALERLAWQPEDGAVAWRYAISLARWEALPRRDPAARAVVLEELDAERCLARHDPAGSGEARAGRRAAMVQALARFPSPEAIEGLLAALRDDPAPLVREEAQRALEERGRDAVAAIAEALAQAEGGGAEAAGYRCDLVHLLARRGPQAHSSLALLRRLSQSDPAATVRDAARAAVARIEGPEDHARTRLAVLPSAADERPSVELTLGPRSAADLGQALLTGMHADPEALAAQLELTDPVRVGRAVADLVSMGRAGYAVQGLMERLLLNGSFPGRRAAAQVLDRLAQPPTRPETLAAYYLARSELARCEEVGSAARPVLREALPLLDWRSAGAVALTLLRLGEPPTSPALRAVAVLLQRVAALPDTRVDERLSGDDRRPAKTSDVSLTVSRAADRRAARELLGALEMEALRLADRPR